MSPAGPQPSARTQQWLEQSSAPETQDITTLLDHSRRQTHHSPSPDALHTAAELSYIGARQSATSDPDLAAELDLDAAQYAWHYLTGAHDGIVRDPNHEMHRPTADIYNRSVETIVRRLHTIRTAEPRRIIRMPLTGRQLEFEVPHPSPWMKPEQVGGLEFVSDYEVRNLRNRHTTSGVGVPVIIQRRRPTEPTPLEKYYAEGVRFPATAILTFPSGDEIRNGASIRVQAWDPRDSDSIVIGDALLPLETDLSTPLARFLTNPNLELLDTFALLRPDRADTLRGLYMIQPYDPDRIPVLLVHGLWSSPMTWMEMFNDLQSDPALRDNFQFWFYMYPTGEPVTFALADLRDELNELRDRCDSYGSTEKLDEMVLIGHSMGGLLSYLMTIDSKDRLWNSVSEVPVERAARDLKTRNELRRVFFFESDPTIDRIVTIASPFQGSGFANRLTRWLGRSLVSLPATTLQVTRLLTKLRGQEAMQRVFTPQTSLDSLAEKSAVVSLIGHTTTPDDIDHHNIVGVSRGWSQRWWSDGVVNYRSAHRSDADSEVIIRAGHSDVHRHPDSVSEVKRVLKEHLKSVRRGLQVLPVQHPQHSDRTTTTSRNAGQSGSRY